MGTRFWQSPARHLGPYWVPNLPKVETISLYDDVTSGVYNEVVTGPYHLLSVADMARRAALARRGVAHLSFPIDVQAKRLADDDKSLGADVQHGTASG